MEQSNGFEAFLVATCVPVLVVGVIWLWYLARGSFQARAMIVALWVVLLGAGIVVGHPFVILIGSAGSATVMLGAIVWNSGPPNYWRR